MLKCYDVNMLRCESVKVCKVFKMVLTINYKL